VRVVVAHELGHRRDRHVVKLTALAMLGAIVAVAVLWAVLGTRVADPRTLPQVLLLLFALELAALPRERGSRAATSGRPTAAHWTATKEPEAFAAPTPGARQPFGSRAAARRHRPPLQPSDAARAARDRRAWRERTHRVLRRGLARAAASGRS
jgi:hypothetical protein